MISRTLPNIFYDNWVLHTFLRKHNWQRDLDYSMKHRDINLEMVTDYSKIFHSSFNYNNLKILNNIQANKIIAAIRKNWLGYIEYYDIINSEKELLLYAIMFNPHIYTRIPEILKQDEVYTIKYLTQNKNFAHVPIYFKTNKEFLLKIIKLFGYELTDYNKNMHEITNHTHDQQISFIFELPINKNWYDKSDKIFIEYILELNNKYYLCFYKIKYIFIILLKLLYLNSKIVTKNRMKEHLLRVDLDNKFDFLNSVSYKLKKEFIKSNYDDFTKFIFFEKVPGNDIKFLDKENCVYNISCDLNLIYIKN